MALIQEVYRVRNCIYLVVNKFGKAYWSDIPSKSSCSKNIKENKLIEMLEFLIDNIYIKVGKEIFRQQVGIPMGTDCAPFLANLFLFYYEYNYMKDLIKNNIHLHVAIQFSYTSRYTDDLLTLNNNRFTKVIPNILS